MFNVTVIKMKDIKKYLLGMIITVILIIGISKYFSKIADQTKKVQKTVITNNMIECLEQTVAVSSIIEDEDSEQTKETIEEKNLLNEILKTQISSIDDLEETNQQEEKVEDNTSKEEIAKTEQQEIKQVETGLKTQVITNNPLKESYNSQYQNVKIKNETEYTLTEDMLKPDVTTDNKNVIIYHTHTCESYTSSEAYPYTPTGNFRTTDLNYTVARVGTELENQLKQYNFNVIHDTTYHDYPSYNGSYAHSLSTAENIIKTTPSDIIIDLHSDAIGSRSDYAPTLKIGENDIAAQVMFVIRNKQWRFMASKLESKPKICNKNSTEGRRIISRII